MDAERPTLRPRPMSRNQLPESGGTQGGNHEHRRGDLGDGGECLRRCGLPLRTIRDGRSGNGRTDDFGRRLGARRQDSSLFAAGSAASVCPAGSFFAFRRGALSFDPVGRPGPFRTGCGGVPLVSGAVRAAGFAAGG